MKKPKGLSEGVRAARAHRVLVVVDKPAYDAYASAIIATASIR
jgi:hypothetical protein